MTDFIFQRENALPDAFCDEYIETLENHPGVKGGETSAGAFV
jgi:hypothetical protein